MTGLGLNRAQYYLFLRRVYGMLAWEALAYIRRVGLPPSADQVVAAIATWEQT